MKKLRVLDLFSGIGGFSLGLERTGGFETAAFCEYEDFPRKVLAKHWPDVPCFPDVRKLKGQDIDGPIDVICGGYPCQPFSTAGQRRGQKDDRHLWPEFNRLVAELRPAWVIGENVAGHISMGIDDVLSDLEGQGYACRTFVVPACATDAPHRRDRVWTVANAAKLQRDGSEPNRDAGAKNNGKSGRSGGENDVANADSERLQRYGRPRKTGGAGGQWQGNARKISSEKTIGNANGKLAYELSSEGDNAEARQPGGKHGEEWSLANAKRIGQSRQGEHGQPGNRAAEGKGQANHVEPKRQHGKRSIKSELGGMANGLPAGMDGHCRWPDEPKIGRVAKDVKNRTGRLKALGNAVVPQIPEMIGRAILQAEDEE